MQNLSLFNRLELAMAKRNSKTIKIEKTVDLNGWKTAYEPVGEL
jgi:hypothetical protein